MPMGQLATCWRPTSHTHSAPLAKPISSIQLVGVPPKRNAAAPSRSTTHHNGSMAHRCASVSAGRLRACAPRPPEVRMILIMRAVLVAVVLAVGLSACGSDGQADAGTKDGKLRVVASFYPLAE